MENLKVAFDIMPDGKYPPVHHTKSSGHLICDVRMMLELKSRWVKDGPKTPQPEWSTFAGVLSREIIRITLTYAALNYIPIFVANVQNAYLQDSLPENITLSMVLNLVWRMKAG